MTKQFYLTCWSNPNRYYLFQVRVDWGVMAMKGYYTFSKALGLEPHHQMQFSVMPRQILIGDKIEREGIFYWKEFLNEKSWF